MGGDFLGAKLPASPGAGAVHRLALTAVGVMIVVADDEVLDLGESDCADHRFVTLRQAQQLGGGSQDVHAHVVRAVFDPGLWVVQQDNGA
jgi:hypothetical protein